MNNKHSFDEKQRFSLRKLTVGLASVLVGLTLFGTAQTVNSQTVHAATRHVRYGDGDDVIGEESALDPSGNPKRETYDVVYETQDQDQIIHYKTPDGQPATDKDGNKIPDGHVTGKTDDMNKDVPMPNGYVPKTPGTDDKTNLNNPDPNTGKVPDKTVTVEHGQHTTAPGETHKTGDPIVKDAPGSIDTATQIGPENKYQEDINKEDVTKDLTRTITVNKPTGNVTVDAQGHQNVSSQAEDHSETVGYNRTTIVDDVTGRVVSHGDWQLADPAKNTFGEFTVPTVDGYTPNRVTINGATAPTDQDGINNYKDPKIVINYTANTQHVNYVFKDGNNTVKTGTVNGVTDQTVTDQAAQLDAVLKSLHDAGYNTSKVNFAAYKFDAANNPDIVIDLNNAHAIEYNINPNVDPNHPDESKIPAGAKDPNNDNKPVTLDDTRKEITRTIIFHNPTHENDTATSDADKSQHVIITRTFNYDPVTKDVTWNNWGTATFDTASVPEIDGYTAHVKNATATSDGKIPTDTAKIGYVDPKIEVSYTANEQHKTYKFVDDDMGGKQVGENIVVNGKTDQTVNPNLTQPANYDLAKDNTIPTAVKLDMNNLDEVTIHLVHHHETAIDKNHIPDGAKKSDEGNVTPEDFSETVTRHITINMPNHDGQGGINAIDKTQTKTLTRTGDYDVVTKIMTFGPWSKDTFEAVPVPTVAGYTPSQDKIDTADATDGFVDPKIEVTYTAQDSTQTIHYVDENGHELSATDNKDQNGDVIKKSKVTVKTDEVGKVQVPKGWKLVDDHDKTTKVSYGDDGTIPVKNVKITHATVEVTPDTHHEKGDLIDPQVPTGSKYGAGLTRDDLNKIAYREIRFNLPASTNAKDYAQRLKANGLSSAHVEKGTNNVIVRQEVAYKRTAIVDAITGEVKGYNPAGVMNQGWVPSGDKLVDAVMKNGGAVFNKVLIPQIAGYTVHTENAGVTTMKLVNGSHAALSQLFVSFMAIPAPKDGNSTGAVNNEQVKPDDTKPGDSKPDTTPVKDLTKSDQKKIADDTKPGKGDDTKPGKTDGTKSGKTDDTKSGKTDGTKSGKTDGTKSGKTDDTKSGKTDGTKSGKSDDTKLGKGDETKPGKSDGTKLGKGDETKPGKSDDTKPGKSDGTKPGKSDDAKPGKSDGTKLGKGDETKPGKSDGTKPGKSDDTKLGKGDETKPGNSDGTKLGKGDETKPGKSDGTKLGKSDGTKPGKSDDAKPGKSDGTKPGKSDGTKPGKSDDTKPGKSDDTKPGKGDDTKPGKGDETKLGKSDDTKLGKGDETKPGKSDGTKLGKSDDTKPGKSDGTKPGKSDDAKPGKTDGTKPGKADGTKPGKKAHVSPTSGANKKNSKITNAAIGVQAAKLNSNAPVGNANDEANKTSHTVQAATVNSDNKALPQTGESQNKIGIIGAVFASLAGMLGLAGTKKKRKND